MTTGFDKLEGWIWINGEFVAWQDAKIHVMTHGLHYGGSVFEGIRLYNGKIFKLRDHMARLVRSAELIGAPISQSLDELCTAVVQAVHKNNLKDGYIRPLAWRGPEEMGIGATKCKTHVMVACWPWEKYFGAAKGISIVTSQWKKADPETAVTESKCAALYVTNTLAKHEAIEKGYDDALMLDYRGYVAEISAANIFIVKNGAVFTPIADCFLNGITRLTVMDLCRQNNISIEETRISVEELTNADEVFITGTLAEVTPVIKIDDRNFEIGEMTQSLMRLYQIETGQYAIL